MTYPPEFTGTGQGQTPVAGPVFNATYDTMGRPTGMTESTTSEVSWVNYNPSSQVLSVCYFGYCDTRTYNSMGQLTEIGDSTEQRQFVYPVGAENGKIAQKINLGDGNTTSFTYDALDRLAGATMVKGTQVLWTEGYVCDGMGNLLQKNVTAGLAPSLVQNVNLANNGSLSEDYDFNGNTISTPGISSMAYDMQNRMIQLDGWNHYAYNAANQRVWRLVNDNGTVTEEFYLYGVNGSRVATYTLQFNPPGSGYAAYATATVKDYSVYFAGRLIGHGEPNLGYDGVYGNGIQAVSTDQVGSVIDDKSLVFGGGDTYQQFYPWGEEKFGSSPNDRVKFATYRRDSESGLDYAWNRYYNNVTGRFLTPDPYLANNGGRGNPYDPQSWNRYTYTRNDPVNRMDPAGLCDATWCVDVAAMLALEGFAGGGSSASEGLIVRPGSGSGPGGASLSAGVGLAVPWDIKTNEWARSRLLDYFANFASSNCDRVFQKAVPGFSTGLFEGFALQVNFYAAQQQPDAGYTQNQVSGNGDPTTLFNSLSLGQAAVTITDGITPTILVGNGILTNLGNNEPAQEDILVHELLHAFTGLFDNDLFKLFGSYGLVRPGDGSTHAISAWIGTDCTKTPRPPI